MGTIVRAALSAAALVAVAGCATESSIEQDVRRRSPSYRISAADLSDDYAEDAHKADHKFRGRVLIVTGRVTDKWRSLTGTPYVTVNAEMSAAGVECHFASSHQSQIDKLRKGDDVTVRGLCEGRELRVTLRGCLLR